MHIRSIDIDAGRWDYPSEFKSYTAYEQYGGKRDNQEALGAGKENTWQNRVEKICERYDSIKTSHKVNNYSQDYEIKEYLGPHIYYQAVARAG